MVLQQYFSYIMVVEQVKHVQVYSVITVGN